MAGMDAETLRGIQGNAAMVIEQMQKLSGTAFGYDEASVVWLDGYINRNRQDLAPPVVERLAMMFAGYLGECIIRCYGGSWGRTDSELGVEFDANNAVFPLCQGQEAVRQRGRRFDQQFLQDDPRCLRGMCEGARARLTRQGAVQRSVREKGLTWQIGYLRNFKPKGRRGLLWRSIPFSCGPCSRVESFSCLPQASLAGWSCKAVTRTATARGVPTMRARQR